MKKVLVVGWDESLRNMGDIILMDCTSRLCGDVCDCEVSRLDWNPANELSGFEKKKCRIIRRVLGLPFYFADFNNSLLGKGKYFARKKYYDAYLKNYYRRAMKGIDAVVVAGGGLKYETQEHSFYTECLMQTAAEYNIPVMLNAIGIESYSENDSRCSHLIKTLNNSTVRVVTTRDDIVRLRENFVTNPDIITDFVADPAWWIPETYGVERESNSEIIGVNFVQAGQFLKYNTYPMSEEKQFLLYADIIKELEKRGHKWVIFTNGMAGDAAASKRVIDMLGESEDRFLPIPETTAQYVDTVRKFKGVIGGRMHALITSFSLGVPVSAYVWSNKLSLFAESSGLQPYFLERENITAKNLVDTLEKAMSADKPDEKELKRRAELKLKTRDYLKMFLESV